MLPCEGDEAKNHAIGIRCRRSQQFVLYILHMHQCIRISGSVPQWPHNPRIAIWGKERQLTASRGGGGGGGIVLQGWCQEKAALAVMIMAANVAPTKITTSSTGPRWSS